MRRTTWATTGLILLGLGMAGLSAADKKSEAKADPATAAIVQGNNQFALNLYGKLKENDGNLFFSPYSISTALGMTYAGARGDTASQMATTLHFDKDQAKFHPAFGKLIKQINGDGKPRSFELHTANALWLQHDYHFLPDFLNLTKKEYGAELREVDFRTATEKTRQTINAWVEKQTKDKIRELLKPGILTPASRLVLTNAIYFKGKWESPFAKEATRDQPFFLADGKQVPTPMMNKQARFGLAETAGLQVLEMPYDGKALTMVVLLPRKRDGLADMEKQLTSENLKSWMGKLRHQEVEVTIPKFQMTSEFMLKDTLSSLGMKDAFDEQKANFSGMSSSRELFIQAVVHKAFVDVNEEGTEAAGATGVVVGVTSAPAGPPPTFKADHPFVFLIRDIRNGSILFMGRVMNPRAGS